MFYWYATPLRLFFVVSSLSTVAIFINDAVKNSHNKTFFRDHYFYIQQ